MGLLNSSFFGFLFYTSPERIVSESFSDSVCAKGKYSCLGAFFLGSPDSFLKTLSQNFYRSSGLSLRYLRYWGTSAKPLRRENPERLASLSVSLYPWISLYISTRKHIYVLYIYSHLYCHWDVCVHTHIHACVYMDISSTHQRALKGIILTTLCNTDPTFASRASSRGKETPHVLLWLQHPPIPPPVPGLPLELPGGWHRWEEQDRDWDGDWGGCDMCPAGEVPSDATGIPCCNKTFPGKEGPGERRRGLVPWLNFIHPSTVSQVAFGIRKSKKYIHRCSLVYLLTLCNLFALICFCLSWDFPF